MRYIRLYLLFIKYSFMQAMMYKENYLTWTLVSAGWFILNLIFYQIIYTNVPVIGGWTKGGAMIVLGLYFIFDFIIWGILWENMRKIPRKVSTGSLDLELLKPINKQFLLSFRQIGMDNTISLVFGIGTIIYGLKLENLTPSFSNVFLSIFSILIAFTYVYSAYFTTMCFSFWAERIDNLHFLFPGIRHFWRFPQDFYKGFVKAFLTFIVPATLITTVPSETLLGIRNLSNIFILITFSIITLIFSSWFFRISLRRYSGASS